MTIGINRAGVVVLCPQAPGASIQKGGDHIPSTGHKAASSGIYANDCHAKQIALSKGETFPPCSHCHPCRQLAPDPRYALVVANRRPEPSSS